MVESEGHTEENDVTTEEILVHIEPDSVTRTDSVKDYLLRSNSAPFNDLNLWDYVASVTKIKRTTENV